MRATLMYGANDVRIEHVSDARLSQPTDAPAGAVRLGWAGGRVPYDGDAM
jgi:hypothetical protein